MRNDSFNVNDPWFTAIMVGFTAIMTGIIGCGHQPQTSVTLEPCYVAGMPLSKIPNSMRPTYLESKDLIIDESYQAWLRAEAHTQIMPPKFTDDPTPPFLQIYKVDGKFYVIAYGKKFFHLTNERDRNCYKRPIEKIVVIPNRKQWKEEPFAAAFFDKPVLDQTMIAQGE